MAKPFYSQYDEWKDAGSPYWQGVAIFQQLRKLPHLLRTFQSGETKYTAEKLDRELSIRLKNVPGRRPVAKPKSAPAPSTPLSTPAAGTGNGAKPATSTAAEQPITPSEEFRLRLAATPVDDIKTTAPSPDDTMSDDGFRLRETPAQHVPVFADSKLKAVPFANLPAVLKKGRMEAMEMDRQRAAMHASLLPVPEAARCIHLRDVLRLMDEKDPESGKPKPFQLKRFTYNRRTREGGELVNLAEVVHLTEAAQANPRPYKQRQESKAAKSTDANARHKPGSHFKNATRNLLLPDGTVEKCIIWLIVEFNGMRVVLHTSVVPVPVLGTEMRRQACKRIVELSDAIDNHYDAERLWADHGVLPFVPEEFADVLTRKSPEELQRMLKNSINPSLSLCKARLRTAEGDDRIGVLRLQAERMKQRDLVNAEKARRAAEAEKRGAKE